jgi:hypothetical protein
MVPSEELKINQILEGFKESKLCVLQDFADTFGRLFDIFKRQIDDPTLITDILDVVENGISSYKDLEEEKEEAERDLTRCKEVLEEISDSIYNVL